MPHHHALRPSRFRHVGVPSPSTAAKRFFSLFYWWTQAKAEPLGIVSLFTATQRSSHRRIASSAAIFKHHRATTLPQDKRIILRKLHSTPRSLHNVSSFALAPFPDPNKHTPGGLSSAEDPNPLSHQIRLIMRHVPHSVVVITSILSSTSTSTSTEPSEVTNGPPSSAYRGMTVSSFNTVALTPRPTVCFNIRAPSATLSAIQGSGRFLVHILDASTAGAKIADAFTRGLGARAFTNSAFEVNREADGMPLLVSRGVRRVLRCQSLGEGVAVGDHVIVLGEVVAIGRQLEEEGEESGCGLLYVNRAYRKIGNELPVRKA